LADVLLPKLDVVGSSPIARSNMIKRLRGFRNLFFVYVNRAPHTIPHTQTITENQGITEGWAGATLWGLRQRDIRGWVKLKVVNYP